MIYLHYQIGKFTYKRPNFGLISVVLQLVEGV